MALGRRKHRQDSLWVATQELPRTGGHVFYERVNRLLDEHGFDRQYKRGKARDASDLLASPKPAKRKAP